MHEEIEQYEKQRKKVDFDSFDITIEELIRRIYRERIIYAPVYQRNFRWTLEKQSKLIESVILGIPVPPLFMATNSDNESLDKWEVVDGVQRLLTLVHFINNEDFNTPEKFIPNEGFLKLQDLEYLKTVNGKGFEDIPPQLQSSILDRPLKVTVLSSKSDTSVRYDLFERLNTGGMQLTEHEVRECVFMGDFIDMLRELAEDKNFKQVALFPEARLKDGTPQEYVLRFFAFANKYKDFQHSVKDFLNDYCKEMKSATPEKLSQMREDFTKTFEYLALCFPAGIRVNNRKVSPVNLYEGVSVGAFLALQKEPQIKAIHDLEWMKSDRMIDATKGATNTSWRVEQRIEDSMKHFLGEEILDK